MNLTKCDDCGTTKEAGYNVVPTGWISLHVRVSGASTKYNNSAYHLCESCKAPFVRALKPDPDSPQTVQDALYDAVKKMIDDAVADNQ